MKNLLSKIYSVNKRIGKIEKNAKNPFYKSNYADLSNIQDCLNPWLEEYKLVVLHYINENRLITKVCDVESGEEIQSEIEITMTDPQKKGSEITYFRRYNLVCLFDLNVSDDDGNATVAKAPSKVINEANELAKLNACKDMQELGNAWTALSKEVKILPKVMALKEQLKAKYND